MKRNYLLLLPFLLSTFALAEKNSEEQSSIEKLEQKMQAINGYYQEVNNKLNNNTSQGSIKQSATTKYIQPNIRRDPFSYTDQMYRNQPKQAVNNNSGNNMASNALLLATTTAFTADGLPIMKYRGFAESPSGEVLGILEILGMGVYTVRVGDQIGLHEIVKELVLVIEGLSRNNIIIKTGKLGKRLVVQ
ncbi:MAG: hypothetical protein JKX76_13945 [Colwellia sp.]|nr:hypothetical protein [Colwellia sp.]